MNEKPINLKFYVFGSLMITVIIVGAILFIAGCDYINTYFEYPEDNIVEELAEEAFKQKTGLDFDFSLQSPEKQLYHSPQDFKRQKEHRSHKADRLSQSMQV